MDAKERKELVSTVNEHLSNVIAASGKPDELVGLTKKIVLAARMLSEGAPEEKKQNNTVVLAEFVKTAREIALDPTAVDAAALQKLSSTKRAVESLIEGLNDWHESQVPESQKPEAALEHLCQLGESINPETQSSEREAKLTAQVREQHELLMKKKEPQNSPRQHDKPKEVIQGAFKGLEQSVTELVTLASSSQRTPLKEELLEPTLLMGEMVSLLMDVVDSMFVSKYPMRAQMRRGCEILLTVGPDTTVLDVRRILATQTGLDLGDIELKFRGDDVLPDSTKVTPNNPVPYFMFNVCEPNEESLKDWKKELKKKNRAKLEDVDWSKYSMLILEKSPDGWWEGRLDDDTKGLFPASFVMEFEKPKSREEVKKLVKMVKNYKSMENQDDKTGADSFSAQNGNGSAKVTADDSSPQLTRKPQKHGFHKLEKRASEPVFALMDKSKQKGAKMLGIFKKKVTQQSSIPEEPSDAPITRSPILEARRIKIRNPGEEEARPLSNGSLEPAAPKRPLVPPAKSKASPSPRSRRPPPRPPLPFSVTHGNKSVEEVLKRRESDLSSPEASPSPIKAQKYFGDPTIATIVVSSPPVEDEKSGSSSHPLASENKMSSLEVSGEEEGEMKRSRSMEELFENLLEFDDTSASAATATGADDPSSKGGGRSHEGSVSPQFNAMDYTTIPESEFPPEREKVVARGGGGGGGGGGERGLRDSPSPDEPAPSLPVPKREPSPASSEGRATEPPLYPPPPPPQDHHKSAAPTPPPPFSSSSQQRRSSSPFQARRAVFNAPPPPKPDNSSSTTTTAMTAAVKQVKQPPPPFSAKPALPVKPVLDGGSLGGGGGGGGGTGKKKQSPSEEEKRVRLQKSTSPPPLPPPRKKKAAPSPPPKFKGAKPKAKLSEAVSSSAPTSRTASPDVPKGLKVSRKASDEDSTSRSPIVMRKTDSIVKEATPDPDFSDRELGNCTGEGKEGQLYKEALDSKEWKDRYFKITRDSIFYYQSEKHSKDRSALGEVPIRKLRGAVSVASRDSLCCFAIKMRYETSTVLGAISEIEKVDWIRSINKVIKEAKNREGPGADQAYLKIAHKCIAYLSQEQRVAEERMLLGSTGNKAHVHRWLDQACSGEDPDLSSIPDSNTASSLLKNSLKQYGYIMAQAPAKELSELIRKGSPVSTLAAKLQQLPERNRKLLKEMLRLFSQALELSEKNQTDLGDLNRMYGPLIFEGLPPFQSQPVLAYLVSTCELVLL